MSIFRRLTAIVILILFTFVFVFALPQKEAEAALPAFTIPALLVAASTLVASGVVFTNAEALEAGSYRLLEKLQEAGISTSAISKGIVVTKLVWEKIKYVRDEVLGFNTVSYVSNLGSVYVDNSSGGAGFSQSLGSYNTISDVLVYYPNSDYSYVGYTLYKGTTSTSCTVGYKVVYVTVGGTQVPNLKIWVSSGFGSYTYYTVLAGSSPFYIGTITANENYCYIFGHTVDFFGADRAIPRYWDPVYCSGTLYRYGEMSYSFPAGVEYDSSVYVPGDTTSTTVSLENKKVEVPAGVSDLTGLVGKRAADVPVSIPLSPGVATTTDSLLDSILSRLNSIADSLANVGTGVLEIPSYIADFFDLSKPINFEPLKSIPNVVSTRFPFSLPWDVSYLLSCLAADPVSPRFTLSLPFISSYSCTVDLSAFDSVVPLVREFFFWGFVVSVIMFHRKVVGGAE